MDKHEISPPIDNMEVDKLSTFWNEIFGIDLIPDLPKDVFLGSENAYNTVKVFYYSEDNSIISTCATVTSNNINILGGLAEVATHKRFRGNGFAKDLCDKALDKFFTNKGQALFLGTSNPIAEKLYIKLGWQKIHNSNVLVNINSNIPYKEFSINYFKDEYIISIDEANPSARIPIIPLTIYPHRSELLDSNINIYSTKYHNQSSCMGLFYKFNILKKEHNGSWFVAKTKSGKIVGISTSKLIDYKTYNIDGFAHPNFNKNIDLLINKSIKWCINQGAEKITAQSNINDFIKQSIFEKLNFRKDPNIKKNNKIYYLYK